jgi:hypothetical protein
MTLTVLDRVLLLNALPKVGDITTVRIVRQLREELSFSEEEHAQLKFEQKPDFLGWNPDANVVKDITLGAKATAVIVDTLKALNTTKQLTSDHLELFDKFVGKDD